MFEHLQTNAIFQCVILPLLQWLMDSSQKLYNLIFKLPQNMTEMRSMSQLSEEIQQIIAQIKILKLENRFNDINSKCNRNLRLLFVSKMLKENFFRVNSFPTGNSLDQPEGEVGEVPALVKHESTNPYASASIGLIGWGGMGVGVAMGALGASRVVISREEYRLKILLVSMFYHMLVTEKMASFILSLQVPLWIWAMLLRSYSLHPLSYLKFRQTEKCLKFVYHLIKNSREPPPKIYIHLIKHLLQLYDKQYQKDYSNSPQDKVQRVKLCYSYIFETAVLILRKNLFLAAQCGVLALLYHKCIEGILPLRKVEVITDIIVGYCTEQQTRTIIHHAIDLGKTFAIFTNVDMVESHDRLQQRSRREGKEGGKSREGVESCAVMIEIYLGSWPTLLYFLQQGDTLRNFVASLKRKSQEELSVVEALIFRKILRRASSYNRRKVAKSNNVFSMESNYLALKSLLVLSFLFRLGQFRELIHSGSLTGQFKEDFIEVLLQYFLGRQEQFRSKQLSQLLIRSGRNARHARPQPSSSAPSLTQAQLANNNIESYCSQSLLPYQFNQQQLRHYLVRISDIVEQPDLKAAVGKLLGQVGGARAEQFEKCKLQNLLRFYQIALDCCKEIKWLHEWLDISKYLSNLVWYLRHFGQEAGKINAICRNYLRCIFEDEQYRYFQFLNINLLDDIGRYFSSDFDIIQYVQKYISDINYAYKISRILLHIDSERPASQAAKGSQLIYSRISKQGSKALVLQVVEIIKFSCQQSDNHFLNEHLLIIFNLVYSPDEDIVYAVIELLQEFVNKTRELEEHILRIDIKRIKHLHKRILYLFLHYEAAVPQINQNSPSFLRDQLEKWTEPGENRKRVYYNFLAKELRKFTHDSIEANDYLNLNFDPSNYHKLIFLPWNIKINEQFYPIFIEYKNLQDKLKLKIYLNLIILREILIDELFIGSHNYTKYILMKSVFEKKQDELKIRLTLQEIKKQHNQKYRQLNRFVIQRQETIFFISYENDIYRIERININIPLTLDTYRPLAHPYNYINLLSRTKYGFQFLKREKFLDHCLEIVRAEEEEGREGGREELRGALVCLGTLCGSQFMAVAEKADMYELVSKRFLATKNYQVQQICVWLLNILIKDPIIRSRSKPHLVLLQTKKCSWVGLPELAHLEKQTYLRSDRIARNLANIKQNLPDRLNDELYRYLTDILNDNTKGYDLPQLEHLDCELDRGAVEAKVVETLIKYVSVIDFDPKRISEVIHRLANYMVSEKFDADYPYPSAIQLP